MEVPVCASSDCSSEAAVVSSRTWRVRSRLVAMILSRTASEITRMASATSTSTSVNPRSSLFIQRNPSAQPMGDDAVAMRGVADIDDAAGGAAVRIEQDRVAAARGGAKAERHTLGQFAQHPACQRVAAGLRIQHDAGLPALEDRG